MNAYFLNIILYAKYKMLLKLLPHVNFPHQFLSVWSYLRSNSFNKYMHQIMIRSLDTSILKVKIRIIDPGEDVLFAKI